MVIEPLKINLRNHTIFLKADWKKVFKPMESSFLIGKAMKIKKGDVLCEIGVGSGINSILAAKLGAERVYATDMNEHAIKWAIYNASLNGVADKTEFKLGNMFEPFPKKTYDIIISDTPFGPLPPKKVLDRIKFDKEMILALCCGKTGGELAIQIIKRGIKRLNPNGRIFFTLGDITDINKVEKILNKSKIMIKKISSMETPLLIKDPEYIKFLKKKGTKFKKYKNKLLFKVYVFEAKSMND